tara:strand:- start:479 stop:856 length:378 start_codon:yes stop_codon:yes gene_type:complete
MNVGRPSKYSDELIEQANEYLDKYTTLIPSHVGLAMWLNVHRDTLYAWNKDKDKYQISDILERIMQMQHEKLMDGGLSGDFNASITKLCLGKHGYTDKQDLSSSDGSIRLPDLVILEGVRAEYND